MRRTVLAALAIALVGTAATSRPTPPLDRLRSGRGAVDPIRAVQAGELSLDQLDRRIEILEKDLATLRKEGAAVEARTVARGRAYARAARAGLLPAADGFDRFMDHAARLEKLRRSLARDMALGDRIARRQTSMARELKVLKERRGPLATEQQAMHGARVALLAARDRELAFQRAFSGAMDDHTAVYGAAPGGDDAGSFATLRGRLPFPVPGRLEAREVQLQGASGPGLLLAVPAGTSVRAIHHGRVVFAGPYAAYGKTVLVAHDGGYYTLFAGLERVAAQVGDDVAAGARLGEAGTTGAGPGLYLEVRRGQQIVPPRPWFGI